MSDLQEQLAALRRKIARIDGKYAGGLPPTANGDDAMDYGSAGAAAPSEARPARWFIEEWMSGEAVETPHGRHFETERTYKNHRRHGTVDISSLMELPDDLLEPLSAGAIKKASPASWAFLDTETTGLAGGSGTYAFLVGVGRISAEGFRIRQFFMRDHGEEASLLWALDQHLAGFDVLVTYNGKAYDQPLLETRFRMARARPPFSRMEHIDLLYGARRLWKLRLESCRLVDLENQILGVERQGDLPGEMIPYVYFEYLRTKQASRLVPVFHHNAIDILTLACLAAIIPFAHRTPEQVAVAHGADLIGVARWFRQAGDCTRTLALMKRAVNLGLPDNLLFRTLWDIACLEKKLGNEEDALAVLKDLAGCRNPFRLEALEALAKHCEHRERDYHAALEWILKARELEDSAGLRHREQRIRRRLAKPLIGRLL